MMREGKINFGNQKSMGGLGGIRMKKVGLKSVRFGKSLDQGVGASIPF